MDDVTVRIKLRKELDDFNGKLQEDIYSHVQVSFAEPIYDKVEKKPVMELRLPQKELIPLLEYLEEFLWIEYDIIDPFEAIEIEARDEEVQKTVKEHIACVSDRMLDRLFEELEQRMEKAEEGEKVHKEENKTEPVCRKEFVFPVNFSPEMKAYIKELRQVAQALYSVGSLEQVYAKSLLISMDDGWGYSAFLKVIQQEMAPFYSAVLKSIYVMEEVIPVENGIAAWEGVPKRIKELSEKATEEKKFLIVAYDMREWMGQFSDTAFLNQLRRVGQYAKNILLVLRIPYMEIKTIRRMEQNLSNVLAIRSIVVPPVTTENMVMYLKDKLGEARFSVEESCEELLEQWICQEKNEGNFYGYKTLDKMAGELIYHKALHGVGEITSIGPADVQPMLLEAACAEDAYQLLNEMIGMAQVKTRVREIVAQIKMQKTLEEQGKAIDKPTMHMMFLGNPGTGKTTVARIVGQIFRQEGLLRKGHFIEKTGNDFIERYIGTTVQKVRTTCRDAYGSVLFIDEAYGMDVGTSTGSTAEEIVPILVAEMENHREDMCVILAGYKEEMKEFLRTNSGLESRIPHVIEFPNYTREELVQIFFNLVEGNFAYEDTLKETIAEYINSIPEEVFHTREFSNGRFVRNLYEHLWGKAAYRISLSGESEMVLKKEDMVSVMEEEDFSEMIGEKPAMRIGFSVV